MEGEQGVKTPEVAIETVDTIKAQLEQIKKEKEELQKKLEEQETAKIIAEAVAPLQNNGGDIATEVAQLKEIMTQMVTLRAQEEEQARAKEAKKLQKAKDDCSAKFNIPPEKLANINSFEVLDQIIEVASATTAPSYIAKKLEGMGYNNIPLFGETAKPASENALNNLSYKEMMKVLTKKNIAEKEKNDINNIMTSFTGKNIQNLTKK